MNADVERDSCKGSPNVLTSLRPIALLVIIVVSGCVVWAVHNGDVFLICTAMILGGSVDVIWLMTAGAAVAVAIMLLIKFFISLGPRAEEKKEEGNS